MLYTEKLDTPTPFRKWAAIFTVAAALERKVWITTNKGKLYPNIFASIVGPPGAGKTVALSVSQEMMLQLNGHHVAPSSVTKASLIDMLNKSERSMILPKFSGAEHFNSLAIISTELGVLIPAYENDFMSTLTDIYDGRIYSETRRTNNLSIEMKKPQLNLLAATTPSYLSNLIPPGAWDQGFMSRMIMIYAGASAPGDLFAELNQDADLYAALTTDLKNVGEMVGGITFEPDAAAAFTLWHKTGIHGGPPVPDHPKLQHYNTRRSAHLLKLCMVASASRGLDYIVKVDDYVEALDWLLEAEAHMPDVFKAMQTGGDSRTIDEAWHFAYKMWMKDNKPVAQGRIVAFLAERTPAHNVGRILEVMISAKMLKEELVDHVGKAYVPKARRI